MSNERISDEELADLVARARSAAAIGVSGTSTWLLALVELQERRATDPEPCTIWQITVPGFESTPDGADYYPDDTEEFHGTEEELCAYILKRETEYRAMRLIRDRSPHGPKSKQHPDPISWDLWAVVLPKYQEGACDEWCRDVVGIVRPEMRQQPRMMTVIQKAHGAAVARAVEIIQAGEAKLAEKVERARVDADKAEMETLRALIAKHGVPPAKRGMPS